VRGPVAAVGEGPDGGGLGGENPRFHHCGIASHSYFDADSCNVNESCASGQLQRIPRFISLRLHNEFHVPIPLE
jgi:hypothetical protein